MSRMARLGAFIFAALFIFALTVFLIGEKQLLFSRTYHLKTTFDNVAGLDEGAPVRVGGVRGDWANESFPPCRSAQDRKSVV